MQGTQGENKVSQSLIYSNSISNLDFLVLVNQRKNLVKVDLIIRMIPAVFIILRRKILVTLLLNLVGKVMPVETLLNTKKIVQTLLVSFRTVGIAQMVRRKKVMVVTFLMAVLAAVEISLIFSVTITGLIWIMVVIILAAISSQFKR